MDKEIKPELISAEIEIKKKTVVVNEEDLQEDDDEEGNTCGKKEKAQPKIVLKDKSKCIKCKKNPSNFYIKSEITCK